MFLAPAYLNFSVYIRLLLDISSGVSNRWSQTKFLISMTTPPHCSSPGLSCLREWLSTAPLLEKTLGIFLDSSLSVIPHRQSNRKYYWFYLENIITIHYLFTTNHFLSEWLQWPPNWSPCFCSCLRIICSLHSSQQSIRKWSHGMSRLCLALSSGFLSYSE